MKTLLKQLSGILLLLAVGFSVFLAGNIQVKAEAKAYEYILPESDSRYYTEAEISDMSLQVLCYAKNEIYARHGRLFTSAELSKYFKLQPWYYGHISASDFSDSILNKYESSNVQTISDREFSLQKGGYLLDQKGFSFAEIDNYILKRYSPAPENATYIFPESNTRYLNTQDIASLSLQQICYGKNEIYARHGRKFDSKELSDYFSSKTWYSGTIAPSNFDDNILNAYESANIQFLTKREKGLSNDKGYQLDQPGYNIYEADTTSYYDDSILLQNDYIFPDSNTRFLSDSEVQMLSPKVLCYAKNEIYARRGRCFESQELVDYFYPKAWYNGYINGKDFSTDIFNRYEAANAKLLEDYEYTKLPGGYELY
ncbi:MAG: YARHG domain-containing protein [Eubacteriales bacterium]|nr:YARHG domain-containing protein [Eubacteriales bacterium]